MNSSGKVNQSKVRRRSPKNERGFALVAAIAVLLLLSMTGLLFTALVRARLDSAARAVNAAQVRYLAHSAVQLAMLERQPLAEALTDAAPGAARLRVSGVESLPERGRLYAGEHPAAESIAFTRSAGDEIVLSEPLRRDIPAGSVLYGLTDLDGDGAYDSVTDLSILNGVVTVTAQSAASSDESPGTFVETIVYRAEARLGGARCLVEAAVIYP
ncbi:MAG: hypothetical protein GC154_14835 [bacterium]|nr:hypothetical protein [bacterium]